MLWQRTNDITIRDPGYPALISPQYAASLTGVVRVDVGDSVDERWHKSPIQPQDAIPTPKLLQVSTPPQPQPQQSESPRDSFRRMKSVRHRFGLSNSVSRKRKSRLRSSNQLRNLVALIAKESSQRDSLFLPTLASLSPLEAGCRM